MASDKARFQKGEMVFFIGDSSKRSLDKNTPYEVVECLPNDVKHYNLSIKIGDNLVISDNSENFISAIDYKNLAKSIKSKFKAGDTVYYIGPDGQGVEQDHPYVLFLTLGGDFSLKVGNKTKHFSQDVVQTFFITEKEYQKKNGITKPDSNKIVTVGSTNFKKYSKFYEGDIVYFIGTENIMLNNDMPYKVQRYDQDRDFIRINGVILKASEVISKKEYEEYNNIDDQDTIEIIGKPRTEIELKHQLWKDTKTGKLKWYRPFASVENWYRTIHILDKPEDSYLRFDLYHSKIDNKWALKSFFHRKKPEIKITESFEFIREYRETSILKLIANFVQNNIKE